MIKLEKKNVCSPLPPAPLSHHLTPKTVTTHPIVHPWHPYLTTSTIAGHAQPRPARHLVTSALTTMGKAEKRKFRLLHTPPPPDLPNAYLTTRSVPVFLVMRGGPMAMRPRLCMK